MTTKFSAWHQCSYEIDIQKNKNREVYAEYDDEGYVSKIHILPYVKGLVPASRLKKVPESIISNINRKEPEVISRPKPKKFRTTIIRERFDKKLLKTGDSFCFASKDRQVVYNVAKKYDFKICTKINSRGRMYVHRIDN